MWQQGHKRTHLTRDDFVRQYKAKAGKRDPESRGNMRKGVFGRRSEILVLRLLIQ